MNRATWNCFARAQRSRALAARHRRARRVRPPRFPPGPVTEARQCPSVHVSPRELLYMTLASATRFPFTRWPTHRLSTIGQEAVARRCRPHCPCRDWDCFLSPWGASQPLHRLELAYKRGRHRPSSRDTAPPSRHCRRPWCHSEPVLWLLAPPDRVAPTFPLHHESLHARLFARPSHQFTEAELRAAAAASLRCARPTVLFPPRVSTQIDPS
jgi:hypothetical protein